MKVNTLILTFILTYFNSLVVNVSAGYVSGEKCKRDCNSYNMNCFFTFHLETMYTMSKACYNCPNTFSDCFRQDCIVGGGLQRTVEVVNRQMPGPPIEVCEGDNVIVLVANELESGEATSIHWHGQHMRGNSYMDGVPYVTQCPIHYNNNFTYQFTASTAGTHFYHSHVEVQRGDGIYGALIVRQPSSKNYHYGTYKNDLSAHVIQLTDWNDQMRIEVFQGYVKAGKFLEPTGILINGFGQQLKNNITNTPLANFNVTQSSTYRFRIINANFFDCPVEFSIDNHKLTVIATDGEDVKPVTVDAIISNSGERFDFILNANAAIGTYWIRVKGYLLCERLGTFQLATLRYDNAKSATPTGARPTYATSASINPNALVLNPLSKNASTRPTVTIDQLRSAKPMEPGISTNYPDKRFFLSFDMSGIDEPANHRRNYYGFYQVPDALRARTSQINHISFQPYDIPMLPARDYIDPQTFCTAESMASQKCESNYCACPHVLKVARNDVVELIFIEEADQVDAMAVHPVHLHGHSYRVITWAELGTNLTRAQIMANHQTYPRNFNNAPLKDSAIVPRGGVTIVRFIADNPGFWLMHCHVDVHAMEGMMVVFKVGENREMDTEPYDFPRCGNW